MDLIHDLLNITLIPSTFFALLFVVPPYYVFMFLLSLFKRYKPDESVEGKVVLITGASSGIGEVYVSITLHSYSKVVLFLHI